MNVMCSFIQSSPCEEFKYSSESHFSTTKVKDVTASSTERSMSLTIDSGYFSYDGNTLLFMPEINAFHTHSYTRTVRKYPTFFFFTKTWWISIKSICKRRFLTFIRMRDFFLPPVNSVS